ncbi:DUF1707 SHOCT-like domain-containing protein [Actinokineospora spheciospongiae]|nr:DUF1707 domain-containing protein [Actinokineospora spheciospongiae]
MSDFEPSGMRVGNAEREDALRLLGEHMSAGRLDVDEYGERTARVTTAKTRGELVALFSDLPAPKPSFLTAPPAAMPPPPPVRWERVRRSSGALVPVVVLGVIAAVVLSRGIALPVVIVLLVLFFHSRRPGGRGWSPDQHHRFRHDHRHRGRDWDDRHWDDRRGRGGRWH